MGLFESKACFSKKINFRGSLCHYEQSTSQSYCFLIQTFVIGVITHILVRYTVYLSYPCPLFFRDRLDGLMITPMGYLSPDYTSNRFLGLSHCLCLFFLAGIYFHIPLLAVYTCLYYHVMAFAFSIISMFVRLMCVYLL